MEKTTSIQNRTMNSTEDVLFSHFSWHDCVLSVLMLILNGGIGIFFGWRGKNQSTAKEYLLAGQNMKILPVVMSLIISHTSGISLLGGPSEVYLFGASYGLVAISMVIVAFVSSTAFIPVFYELNLKNSYEYLALRFDQRTMKCASHLYILSVIFLLPIIFYLPALTFSAATGIDVHVLTPIVCGICILYTSIGGLKALIWIDSVQFSIVFGSFLLLIGFGIGDYGDLSKFWSLPVVQDRLDIWNSILGIIAFLTSFCLRKINRKLYPYKRPPHL